MAIPPEVPTMQKDVLAMPEPMKVSLGQFTHDPFGERFQQPMRARRQLPNPNREVSEKMACFAQVAKVADLELQAAQLKAGYFGDRFPNPAEQVAYAQEVAEAAKLELQVAMLKAQIQMEQAAKMKQAAEMAAVAGRMGDSMACMRGMLDNPSRTTAIDDILGRQSPFRLGQMQMKTSAKPGLPPGLC
jgi:hypothetical protein